MLHRSVFSLVIELYAGEGGADSRQFVEELSRVYLKYADRLGLKTEIIESTESSVSIKIDGKGAASAFANEGGKHCVQRVPETEARGRRHTSIVGVAVVEINSESEQCGLNLQHVKITTTCGGGPGGQAVNKQETTVIAQHIPTGLRVRIQTRSQGESKRIALNILEAKVQKQAQEKQHAAYAEIKSQQLGTGGRGDKVRTYNFIDCWVLDHRTGKRSSKIKEIMKGHLEEILT